MSCKDLIKTLEEQIADEKKGSEEYEKMSKNEGLTEIEKRMYLRMAEEEKEHAFLIRGILMYVKDRC